LVISAASLEITNSSQPPFSLDPSSGSFTDESSFDTSTGSPLLTSSDECSFDTSTSSPMLVSQVNALFYHRPKVDL